MHEGTWLKRMYMYNNNLDKMDIYMKLNINKKMKQIQKWEYKFKMYESSKLDYTSTSNGNK